MTDPLGLNKSGDVLHEDELGSNFAHDTEKFISEVAFIVLAGLLSGLRPRLARDSGSDEVDVSL